MLLLSNREIAKKVRYVTAGARNRPTTSQIQNRYDHYVQRVQLQ